MRFADLTLNILRSHTTFAKHTPVGKAHANCLNILHITDCSAVFTELIRGNYTRWFLSIVLSEYQNVTGH